ncbi:GNAT family N-acetyltransferase [Pseudobacillus badius]|uniref:GNAT family N-acetyltransferase n=1 Tax=Bacillus badius TaxID=1455 RepID=UPI0024A02432|nr:GNAT family N-acetyltransferase [Bacillus badius]MED0666953.1 GNAT family N-acetyltransferase [Bacillus badius]GLY10858.1 N-acetyltransferase [Bacillus badius]
MAIRKATFAETQRILQHSLHVWKEASVGYVQPSWEKAFQLAASFLQGGGYYLLYVEGPVIQGWIAIGEMRDFYIDEAAGFIQELYVLPPYRSRGVAEKLCTEAFRQLKAKGYRKVQLNVFAGNRAKQLYEKLGFYEVCTTMERNLENEKD